MIKKKERRTKKVKRKDIKPLKEYIKNKWWKLEYRSWLIGVDSKEQTYKW